MNWQIVIFSFFGLITIFALVIWLWKRRSYADGQFYDTAEVVTLYALPRTVIIWFIVLLVFFILELNKLHLLYVFPIIYFVINAIQAKRVLKEENKGK